MFICSMFKFIVAALTTSDVILYFIWLGGHRTEIFLSQNFNL